MRLLTFELMLLSELLKPFVRWQKLLNMGQKTIDINAKYRSLMASDLYFEDFMTDFFEYDDFSDFGRGQECLKTFRAGGMEWSTTVRLIR